MERCPGCSARIREAVTCPRCRADLSLLISAEQESQFWLTKAINFYSKNKTEQSVGALCVSLGLKKTRTALVFRDFLIQRQCRNVLDLLVKKKLLAAKHQLYHVRQLIPKSNQLQKLQGFTDYLFAKNQEQLNLVLNVSSETKSQLRKSSFQSKFSNIVTQVSHLYKMFEKPG